MPRRRKSQSRDYPLRLSNEVDQHPLCPASVVSIRRSQEGAVATVRGFDEVNCWIANQLRSGFGLDTDKRIIICMKHQSGNADVFQDASCCCAMVVVVGSGEAFVTRGDLVIELANAGEAA